MNDAHFISSENANLFQNIRKSMLRKCVSVQEDSGNDFKIFFNLIKNVILIEDDCPRLNPSRNR